MEIDELKEQVRRASRGDERAAAYIFDTYHPRVYRYALARLRNPSDADDVAAETFARVLRELGRFKWKASGFEAWIFRIASNLVVDTVRKAGREYPSPDGSRPDTADERTPEHAVITIEGAREMNELIEHLAPDQRQVVLLRFAAGLDTSEVAKVMDRKPNAIRQLQFRALTALRARMEQGVEAT